MADWKKLLNGWRRDATPTAGKSRAGGAKAGDTRTELERDYDRILFSTPVRRLADKTQVFPLEKHDSVRNRLTHSHEVANLARSIGTYLAFHTNVAAKVTDRQRDLPAALAAAGLAHDLGNPPFGHQGEEAIQSWFRDMNTKHKILRGLTKRQKNDFLRFEGNAQTFRLVTRLQPGDSRHGLNLSFATLAALVKYPTFADDVNRNHVSKKKFGIFSSEEAIVSEVWKQTGLRPGKRHPLTFLMEACDDIAYTILDAEDAVKKGLVSFWDLISYLESHAGDDPAIRKVVAQGKRKHQDYSKESLSPAELNDVSTQRFRVFVINRMVIDVRNEFLKRQAAIESGRLGQSLLDVSESRCLRNVLKDFDSKHAYAHRSVREIELQGYNTIRGLMDFMWTAVSSWKRGQTPPISNPFPAYVYSRISENYRRVFEDAENRMPERYKQLQLMGDMISGMTDSFAIDLYEDLCKYRVQ
jgi:dGTPase